MTQKRKVGPGGGDFALNPNKFSGVNAGGRTGAKLVAPPKLKPMSEMSSGVKKEIKDKAFKIFSDRTKKLEAGQGGVDDVNPLTRVMNQELRTLVKEKGFDATPADMGKFFPNNNRGNLKRFRGGKLSPEDKATLKKFRI